RVLAERGAQVEAATPDDAESDGGRLLVRLPEGATDRALVIVEAAIAVEAPLFELSPIGFSPTKRREQGEVRVMHPARAVLSKAQRVVVKIGSRSLATDADLIPDLARQIAGDNGGRSYVVVTSGAIALGTARLGYRRRPKEMPGLQAAAAAGQSVLMQ